MIVLKYKRLPAPIAKAIPPGFVHCLTQSGWVDAETFLEYISSHFLPWMKTIGIELPVILFFNGQYSHMSLGLCRYYAVNGFVLVALYPNTTHFLQPVDVGIFRVFKLRYRQARDKWTLRHGVGTEFDETQFMPVLKQALYEIWTNENILQNAFRACVDTCLICRIFLSKHLAVHTRIDQIRRVNAVSKNGN